MFPYGYYMNTILILLYCRTGDLVMSRQNYNTTYDLVLCSCILLL